MSKLSELYQSQAVERFGHALRISLRPPPGLNLPQDYSSLVELEYVEKCKDLAVALKKFLRRFDAQTRRAEKEGRTLFKPSEDDLNKLLGLCEEYSAELVAAALVSHALVFPTKLEEGER